MSNPVSGTVTIESTGSSLTLSGSGQGWQADGSVITFQTADDTLYVLALELPQNLAWNESATLQIFQGDENLCGFYSKETGIQAFNNPANPAAQFLSMILNLEDENHLPVPFTVFLYFPTETSTGEPDGSPSIPMPISNPAGGEISGTAQVENNSVTKINWKGSGRGWSTNSEGSGGQVTLQRLFATTHEGPVTAWNLSLHVAGDGWELGSSPAFEFYCPSNPACGVVFAGPHIKAYNYLQPKDEAQTFTLALRLVKGTSMQWFQDPTILFDPPDPPREEVEE